MLLLGRAAERRGLTMFAAANEAGVSLRVFGRYFDTKRPSLRTVEAVGKGLGLPIIVARALCEQLTSDEIRAERELIAGEIGTRGRRLFGERATVASLAFQARTGASDDPGFGPRLPREAVGAAAVASVLARFGLETASDPVLGPYLGAVDAALGPYGFTLRAFVDDPLGIAARRREGVAAFLWMRSALDLSSDDEARIANIIAPYVDRAPHQPGEVDALEAARAAYHDAIRRAKGS